MDLNSLPRLAWRRLLFSSLTCSDHACKKCSTNNCNDRERESLKSHFSHNIFTTKLLCVTCSFFRAATLDSRLAKNYTWSLEKTQRMKKIDSADIPNSKSNTLETRFVVWNLLRNFPPSTCPELTPEPWPSSLWLRPHSAGRLFWPTWNSHLNVWASQQPSALPASLVAWKLATISCAMYLWASLRAFLSTFGRHVGSRGDGAKLRQLEPEASHSSKENSFRECKGCWEKC